ncbi:MAG: SWIM zinc finger family protein [archaeon]
MGYYEYYHFPKASPRPKAAPGKERKKFGATWWGKRWVDLLSKFEYDQRMSRGRAYARANHVKNFKISEGKISATVQGSSGNYRVSISFDKFKEKEWDEITAKLSEVPILFGKLLNNEMPENMKEITGFEFIPDKFKSECSCPDYANPCKHIAAVFYTLADEIDYSPMILFALRGKSKESLFEKTGLEEKQQQPVKSSIELAKTKKIKTVKKAVKSNTKKKANKKE